jgi:hypothetical protein
MPAEGIPSGVEVPVLEHASDFANAATVGPDFNAATLVTIAGGADGFIVRQKCRIKKLLFRVGPENFAGAGGTLTFELRRDSATGGLIASITIPLATALRGAIIESLVLAANAGRAQLKDGDKLFLVRLATGTAFTTGRGTFAVIGWVRPQAIR